MQKPNLLYTSDEQSGYKRRKWGRGFSYFDHQNQRLNCPTTLKRIKSLVIPPIWNNVWICPLQNGHLQSTGRDQKRRKQYLYHQDWIAFRQAKKFEKMIAFAEALPNMRKIIDTYLAQKKWTINKVLSLAVKVLDNAYIRIGNQQYAQRNNTYGLTTMRRKHLNLEMGEITFSYKAKSNKYREVNIENKRLVKLIKECSELPGYEVFRYRDDQGNMQSIDSHDVNEFIQKNMGEDFSSKDFRTWAGTSLAVKYYPDAQQVITENSRKKLEPTLVKMVSKELGNTMSVCRKYYIHPDILEAVKAEKIPHTTSKTDSELEDYEIITKEILSHTTQPAYHPMGQA